MAGQSSLRLSGLGMLGVFVALIVLAPVVARPALALGRALPVVRVVGRLAQQNAARNPKRTGSTGSALMIGLGIVSLFLVVNASLRASLDDTVDNQFEGDVVIDSGGSFVNGGLPGDIAAAVNALPEVDAATGVRFGFAQIAGTPVGLRAIDPDTGFDLFPIEVADGDVSGLDADGIAVFEGIAEEGLAGGRRDPGDLRRHGRGPVHGGRPARPPRPDRSVRDGRGRLRRQPARRGRRPDLVRLADGVTVDEARPDLESVVARSRPAEVQDLDEFKAAMKGQYDIILVLVNALLTLTIVIAMIGIVNTLILSVVERTRDRPHPGGGRHLAQVRSAIRWEALIIAAFGLVGSAGRGRVLRLGAGPRPPEEGFGCSPSPPPSSPPRCGDGGTDPGGLGAAGGLGRAPPGPFRHRRYLITWGHGARPRGPAPRVPLVFVGERHLATLTTLRPDGSPHSTPVGFTWDPSSGLVRIISWASSRKVRNLAGGGRASVCQVDGGRWLTFEGPAQVTDDPPGWPRPSGATPSATGSRVSGMTGSPSRSPSTALGGRDGRLPGTPLARKLGIAEGIGGPAGRTSTGRPPRPARWRGGAHAGAGVRGHRVPHRAAHPSGGFRR